MAGQRLVSHDTLIDVLARCALLRDIFADVNGNPCIGIDLLRFIDACMHTIGHYS